MPNGIFSNLQERALLVLGNAECLMAFFQICRNSQSEFRGVRMPNGIFPNLPELAKRIPRRRLDGVELPLFFIKSVRKIQVQNRSILSGSSTGGKKSV